jgi:competence protein ComEC
VRRPAHYLNPGVPDDRVALARRGLTLVGSVKSGALVEILARGSWREEWSARLRARVRRALDAHVAIHDADAAEVATAILIGDRGGLDADLERRLQKAGTYHVIAISGGNIAILAAVLLALARLARLPPAAAGPVVALLLVAHASAVGAGASVVRATAMAVIYLGLRAVDQSAWSVNALSAACAGLLAASPLSIVDPGFLLSAGATAAILVLAGRLSKPPGGRWHRAAARVVGASLATEIVLLPISATIFGRVTLAGLVLNLAAVPLMAVVQGSASVTVLASDVVPRVAAVSGYVAASAAGALVGSAGLVEWAPWLAIRMPPPAAAVTATYLAAVLLLAAWPHWPGTRTRTARRLRLATRSVAVGMAVVVLTAPSTWRWPWRADARLRIVALDVGQGDATLVEFPDGSRWLVDAGGLPGSSRYDIGARVVAPALWHRGVGRLDALVLTHGDPDHIGGAASVVDDFRPAIHDGIPVASHPGIRQLAERARLGRRPWTTLARGDTRRIGGADVRVWHPLQPDWERQRVRNDDSVVLELRYGDVSFVLPGDIGADVEAEIARLILPARHRVLKAAHHGSATSTSDVWLDALRPEVVLISCGRENRYGHPAPAVLARLAARGIEVRRTDVEGQIVIETDGVDISISSTATKVTKVNTKVTKKEGDLCCASNLLSMKRPSW